MVSWERLANLPDGRGAWKLWYESNYQDFQTHLCQRSDSGNQLRQSICTDNQLRLLRLRWRRHIVNYIGTRPRVLITAFLLRLGQQASGWVNKQVAGSTKRVAGSTKRVAGSTKRVAGSVDIRIQYPSEDIVDKPIKAIQLHSCPSQSDNRNPRVAIDKLSDWMDGRNSCVHWIYGDGTLWVHEGLPRRSRQQGWHIGRHWNDQEM